MCAACSVLPPHCPTAAPPGLKAPSEQLLWHWSLGHLNQISWANPTGERRSHGIRIKLQVSMSSLNGLVQRQIKEGAIEPALGDAFDA